MAVRILRRIKAAQDAEEIAEFIAKHSLPSALRFVERLEETLLELPRLPEMGGFFPSTDSRLVGIRIRRIAGFSKYLIFYRTHPGAIEVIRILHGARNLDQELVRSE